MLTINPPLNYKEVVAMRFLALIPRLALSELGRVYDQHSSLSWVCSLFTPITLSCIPHEISKQIYFISSDPTLPYIRTLVSEADRVQRLLAGDPSIAGERSEDEFRITPEWKLRVSRVFTSPRLCLEEGSAGSTVPRLNIHKEPRE
ncbi:hypothetical protein R1flu_008740 [Riccia fluitans]|uniref:Uncharacterized protein n=1 Tax=Riccia fluitans TaxID=41844 RepID=A0ABD1YCS3_9MARC